MGNAIEFYATIRMKKGGSHYITIPAERVRYLAESTLKKTLGGKEVRVEVTL